MIPLYGISSLLTGITSLSMSLFVLVKGPRIKSNRIWSTLTLCVAIYGFGAYMVSLAQDPRSALFWWQIAYIGIILIPVFFMHFTCASLGLKRPLLLKSLYIVSGILWILNILNGGFFLGKAALFFTGSKVFKPGYWVYPASPLLYFFIFIFVAVAIWSHQELTKGFQKSTGLKRNQLKYFLPASALAFAGGFTSFLPCFNIQLYPVFNIMVAIYPLIMGYAIIRYRLMDITVAVTRTGIFVAVYTLVLGIPFAVGFQCKDWLIRVFGANWWVAPSGLMAILATVGPFIYIYLQRKAEDRLLREQRRYHEVLKETGAGITRIRNLQKLLDLIVSIVTENVRLSHAAIYLYDSKTRQFCLRSGRNLKKDQPFSISRESAMITWLNHHREPLVYEEIKENTENGASAGFRKLKEQMSLLNAAVVLPSFLEEKLSNLLILGNKLSGRIYTSEDLSNFSILANATAVGIENALLYENIEEQVRQRTKELVETQKQLIQAEKLATVGTLAGGVAHEINNPLTAILTNIQMLLSGDEADELKADRESLELIEEATKRCRTIVQKLMTYAKKPLEVAEFSELNVLNAVKNVVTFLGYQLEQDNVKIIVKAKETDYPVIGNQNELEQVITNIILNARDAIRQAKKSGDITISLADSTDAIKIEIRDEGVGIAKDIMPKIFDPFFTTKDVGKGVGLGLSICQSIVEKHSGTITAQSEPHKGSVFTVTLPKAGRQ
jgi:signal transduction histidine kinase